MKNDYIILVGYIVLKMLYINTMFLIRSFFNVDVLFTTINRSSLKVYDNFTSYIKVLFKTLFTYNINVLNVCSPC